MKMIELGMECRDIITGFQGIVCARYEYITGCVRYDLQPQTLDEGKVAESFTFDEGRLDIVGRGILPAEVGADANPGGPRPKPAHHRTPPRR